MKIEPSVHFKDEFVVTASDARAEGIIAAIGSHNYQKQTHMTRVRAHKADLLYRFGFTAIGTDDGWRFVRGQAKPMPLHFALWVVEAMQ